MPRFLRTTLATDDRPRTWWRDHTAKRLAIGSCNPNYDGKFHRIRAWLVEFGDDDYPWREIALDEHGDILFAGPSAQDYGYWLDTEMRYADFTGEPVEEVLFEQMWRASGVVAPE